MPEIMFLRVSDNRTKLISMQKTLTKHFAQRKRLLITAPNPNIATYIDTHLWSFPEESFLPHHLTNKETKEPIAITTQHQNINHAHILFNVCPIASPIAQEFEIVYELFDETESTKRLQSLEKKNAYKNQGFTIVFS